MCFLITTGIFPNISECELFPSVTDTEHNSKEVMALTYMKSSPRGGTGPKSVALGIGYVPVTTGQGIG